MDDLKCVVISNISTRAPKGAHLAPGRASSCILLQIQQGNSALRINSAFPVAGSGSWKTVLLTRGTQNYVLAVVLLVSFLVTNIEIAHGNTKQDHNKVLRKTSRQHVPRPKNHSSSSHDVSGTFFNYSFITWR